MTPKQQVLQRYPGAFVCRHGFTCVVWRDRESIAVLSQEKTRTAAWRAAAKAVAKEGKCP